VTDEEAMQTSAYTLLNFKLQEAAREQESARLQLERLQWEVETADAHHRVEIQKLKAAEISLHEKLKQELQAALTSASTCRADKDALQRQFDEKQLQPDSSERLKEVQLMVDTLTKDNARLQAETRRLQTQSSSATKRAEAAESGKTEELVVEMKSALEAKDTEIEEYLAELEEVGKAYENMREQNTRLLEQLRDKEDSNTRLVSEKIKAKQTEHMLRVKNQNLERKASTAEKAKDASDKVQQKLDAQLKSAVEQVENLLQAEQLVMQLVESHKGSAREALQLFNNSRTQLDTKQSALDKMEKNSRTSTEDLMQKSSDNQRLQEEVTALTKKLDYFNKTTAKSKSRTALSGAEAELEQLKQIISCPIKLDQRIGLDQFCVIAKCWHVFSRDGIDTNLQNRNRKCPACASLFDRTDVKDIFIVESSQV